MNESVDAGTVIELYQKKVAELTHDNLVKEALIMKLIEQLENTQERESE